LKSNGGNNIMWERNDGISESHILQNQFTAYLVTAIRRRKIQYMRSKIQIHQCEISLEIQEHLMSLLTEPDMHDNLPLLEQLENMKLREAMEQTKERDLHIFLLKALEGRSLAEIAAKLGIGYNTAASVYYRMIERLKKELGGEKE
ncbi:MAG: sigma-70 family RNA polymerase sigma factor, partial [Oscillospiraceae bacterium]|nr:sigma-70 family RNA polymerase sigma factor [Oscillospiraceae bacterium]